MLAIPLPFVVSMLLSVLAASIWLQRRQEANTACAFLLMCAITTTLAGLRWTFDWALLRTLLPISASLIPVMAWRVFVRAKQSGRPSWVHSIVPLLIVFSALTYRLWYPPIDMVITLQYVVYGVALLRATWHAHSTLENVRISDLEWAYKASLTAAGMLLFSAVIDSILTVDFMLYDGEHALLVLTIGHALLLPILSLAVIFMSLSTPPTDATNQEVEHASSAIDEKDGESHGSAAEQAIADAQITQRAEQILLEQSLYLDPDLTLARIARKVGIPARQISAAINQVYGQNIPQWVNQYRIRHAQTLLAESNASVTQIYLDSGFQTKSNFHREFSRIVGTTPSAYRKAYRGNMTDQSGAA